MKIFFYFLILVSLTVEMQCKSRIAKNTLYLPYENIELSKSKGVFFSEYLPENSVIKIGGVTFNIGQAWVEQPHYEKNFGDEILSGFICVMNVSMSRSVFTEAKWRSMDIHHYIKEYGYGNSQIWFSLADLKENIKDTIIVHYRRPVNTYEEKGFMLLRKK